MQWYGRRSPVAVGTPYMVKPGTNAANTNCTKKKAKYIAHTVGDGMHLAKNKVEKLLR